jgi:hypothetical protein
MYVAKDSIDVLIAKATDHADIIRMCARTFSEQKSGDDDVEAEQFINAMNFANRMIYQYISNLEHCKSVADEARVK